MDHFAAIAALLEENGLDAMLLTEEANRFYATGFHSIGTDGCALVCRNKNYYFTDSRYTEAAARHVKNAELGEVGRGRDYAVLLNEVIEKEGLRRVGFDDAYMTVRDCGKYREKLHAELVPASDLLASLRRVKDAEEIESMIAAQRIAEKALSDILHEIKPGVTEKEFAARLQYLMLHYGAENMSFDPIVVSGPNGSLPHGVPSEKTIQAGEFVTMDFGCIKNGYCSDMTRTIALGYVSEKMDKVYHTVLEAQLAGIAATKAGATGKEMDAAARNVINAAGFEGLFGHSYGHSLGLLIHEGPYANTRNDKPMPAGAVVSAEPGIYIPDEFGVRIEDVTVITETGCEILTKSPKNLIIL